MEDYIMKHKKDREKFAINNRIKDLEKKATEASSGFDPESGDDDTQLGRNRNNELDHFQRRKSSKNDPLV